MNSATRNTLKSLIELRSMLTEVAERASSLRELCPDLGELRSLTRWAHIEAGKLDALHQDIAESRPNTQVYDLGADKDTEPFDYPIALQLLNRNTAKWDTIALFRGLHGGLALATETLAKHPYKSARLVDATIGLELAVWNDTTKLWERQI